MNITRTLGTKQYYWWSFRTCSRMISMTCQVFTTVSARKKREALLRAKCVALELNKIGRSGHTIRPFAHNIWDTFLEWAQFTLDVTPLSLDSIAQSLINAVWSTVKEWATQRSKQQGKPIRSKYIKGSSPRWKLAILLVFCSVVRYWSRNIHKLF